MQPPGWAASWGVGHPQHLPREHRVGLFFQYLSKRVRRIAEPCAVSSPQTQVWRGPTDTPTPPLAPARSPETGDSSLDDPCLPSGRQGRGWGWGQLLQASLLARADPSHALSLLLCPGVCRWLWATPVGRCKPARESALPAGAHPDQHRGSGRAI